MSKSNALPNLSEHKQRVAGVYNLASSGYDLPAVRFFSLAAQRLVEFAQLEPGMSVFDAATGTGVAAFAAAQKVGPHGHVVGVDIAQEMLTHARRKADAQNHSNVSLQIGDIEHVDAPDNSYDRALCASGIFFLPNMAAGAQEWRRITKPGGWVAFSSYGESAFQPLSDLYEARIRSFGVPLAAPQKPFSWQRLSDRELCRDILRQAGLEQIDVREEQLGYYLKDADDWWDIVWNSGFRGPVSQLSAEALERFTGEHLAEAGALSDARGIWLDVPVIVGRGRKTGEP